MTYRITLMAVFALAIAACDESREPTAPATGADNLVGANTSSPGAV